ncbi:MAG: CopG family transcriptional regulator [Candidatus Binatia bacterium]
MAKPLQVYLDDEDLLGLERWAKARGWTKSQAVRVAVRALTRPKEKDGILELAGMIDGLPEDASEDFDRYLNETYVVSERQPAYGRGRRSARRRVRR